MAINYLDDGSTGGSFSVTETDTQTSTDTTSTVDLTSDTNENKTAAYIDLQTSGAGNVDEQLQGGTTADQVISDVTTNPDVTQELAEMTATGDATLPVPNNEPMNVPAAPDLAGVGQLGAGAWLLVAGALLWVINEVF